MPLRANNQRTFHRCLYSGILQTIVVLKRNDDQQQGTVRSIKMFQVRQSMQTKTGEAIQGDMSSDVRCSWHIPKIEMDRVGIAYFNVLDRIVDKHNRYWQPEAPQTITNKLFEDHYCLDCVRIDPPNNQLKS